IYVMAAFGNAPHPHSHNGHITAEQDALGSHSPDSLLKNLRVRIGRDVEHHIPRLCQYLEGVSNILNTVRPADMRDYQLDIRVLALNAKHLLKIDRVTKPF